MKHIMHVSALVLAIAACSSGPRGPGDSDGAFSPLTLEPPPVYALLGYRADLDLTSQQVAALDSIAEAVVATDFDGNVLWSFSRNEQIETRDGQTIWSSRQHHDWQRDTFPAGYYSPAYTPPAATQSPAPARSWWSSVDERAFTLGLSRVMTATPSSRRSSFTSGVPVMGEP